MRRIFWATVVAAAIWSIGVDHIWAWLEQLAGFNPSITSVGPSTAISNVPLPIPMSGPSALLGAIIAAFIAIIALRINSGVNLRNKRVDIIDHCNSRYLDLYKLRITLIADDKELKRKIENAVNLSGDDTRKIQIDLARYFNDEASYFKQYWGLKSDQFDYWLAGYIDHETIASWTMQMADSLAHHGIGETPLDYRKNLLEMRIGHEVINPRFVRLVKFVFIYIGPIKNRQVAFLVLLHYLRIIEKGYVRLIDKLSKSSFGRLYIAEYAEALTDEDRRQYMDLSPQITVLQWRSKILRLWRMPLGTYWHEVTARRQLGVLKRHLKKRLDLEKFQEGKCDWKEVSVELVKRGVRSSIDAEDLD